ncbi:hypothetical protein MKW98_020161 [Papaver atlanticum]|uniref:Uncharacterized protein n=1 Tax=Papaver atlanticum TaxID=357466 RepID=A0AAD4XBV2_9MAGN|nr:hypothetical protein MKW98_020161 [Papaver atlanticum]
METKMEEPQVVYGCKKCRRMVVAHENVVSHEPGAREQCFKWKKRSMQCSCGTWVNPAFQLHKYRIDECPL